MEREHNGCRLSNDVRGSGRALGRAISGARYVEIAEASHGLPIQLPERVNALLEENFARRELSKGVIAASVTQKPGRRTLTQPETSSFRRSHDQDRA